MYRAMVAANVGSSIADIAVMSPPAENARPRPVRTAAPIVAGALDRLDRLEQAVEHLVVDGIELLRPASVMTRDVAPRASTLHDRHRSTSPR